MSKDRIAVEAEMIARLTESQAAAAALMEDVTRLAVRAERAGDELARVARERDEAQIDAHHLAAMLAAAERERDDLRAELNDTAVELADAANIVAERDALHALLARLEWSGRGSDGMPCCPECGGYDPHQANAPSWHPGYHGNRAGHVGGCALAKAVS